MMINLSDNGGRRLEGDRRQLISLDYAPDRRSGVDRRVINDRRTSRKKARANAERRIVYEALMS